MKKRQFIVLLLLLNVMFGTSINYFNYVAYYKAGEESAPFRCLINNSGVNEFSNKLLVDLDYNSQLYLNQQSIQIGCDQGDSAIAFVYDYRYYKENENPEEWKHVDILFSNRANPYPGAYYTIWYIHQFPLLSLPLDTGRYAFEIAISSTVVGEGEDTLCKCYVCPDDQELISYFEVNAPTEQSSSLEMSKLLAKVEAGSVNITWKTYSETNNSHFILKRNGEYLARIEGAGTSSHEQLYEFIDFDLPNGDYVYVLSDFDYSGKENICDSLCVSVAEAEAGLLIHPNPFNNCAVLSICLTAESKIHLGIYDLRGRVIENVYDGRLNEGEHDFSWKASSMPSGIYIVKMLSNDSIITKKLLLLK